MAIKYRCYDNHLVLLSDSPSDICLERWAVGLCPQNLPVQGAQAAWSNMQDTSLWVSLSTILWHELHGRGSSDSSPGICYRWIQQSNIFWEGGDFCRSIKTTRIGEPPNNWQQICFGEVFEETLKHWKKEKDY